MISARGPRLPVRGGGRAHGRAGVLGGWDGRRHRPRAAHALLVALLGLSAIGCAASSGSSPPNAPATAPATAAATASAPPAAQPVSADPTAAASLAAVRDAILASGTCDTRCLDALRALWAAHPGDPDLRVTLTNALIQRQDWSGIEAVIRSLPNPSDADRLLMAKAMIKLGRFDDAAAILQPLVDARPDDPDLAYNAAFADYYGNRHDQASAVLDRAWAALVAARDANAQTLRAMIHLDGGELDQAAAVAGAVVDQSPEFFPAWDVLGRARAAAGDEAGANEAFDRVAAIHAATSERDARQLRLSAQATALQAAWRDRDLAGAERLVDAMLPEADAALKHQLYEYAVAIYDATGRPAEAAAARDAAARLPLAEEAP